METEPFRLAIEPSQPRRMAGVGMLALLGLVMGLLALGRAPDAPGLRVAFLICAIAAFLFARWLWRSTASGLVLDAAGLREVGTGGRFVAPMEAVRRVERGPFAFKPSNGFLLKTSVPGSRVWRPGVWWRLGRRIGVGGVLNAAQARAAAEVLEAAIVSSSPSTSADRSGDG